MRGMAPEMAQIALRLGTTEWGLRRALTREDTRYRDLLDSVRSELASDYVRETPLSFTDIADLLGFANPSAFQKAFRRWYGCSPGIIAVSEGGCMNYMSMPSSMALSSSSSGHRSSSSSS